MVLLIQKQMEAILNLKEIAIDDKVNEKQLTELYTNIMKDTCIPLAIQRGHDYNDDGNMVGSFSEYSIDDICSLIKVKAIRCKRAKNNPVISKREMPDIINYAIEILRRI